jgi:hypothetical protein
MIIQSFLGGGGKGISGNKGEREKCGNAFITKNEY